MATTKFIHPPIPPSHVSPPKSSPKRTMNAYNSPLLLPTYKHFDVKFGETPCRFIPHSFPPNTAELAEGHSEYSNVIQIKEALFAVLQGINRGIFGVPSEKKTEIEKLVELLESQNPTPQPTVSLKKVDGSWKLIYSTITILGSKRTKLGLRDFITLGDFFQTINIAEGKAVNTIKFSARGLNLFAGQLTIDASFKISSPSRVDISYNKSVITPDQLMNVFRKSYNLLLGIFNPEGWLEITYVDDCLRIGRDDKGNMFILERADDDVDKI